MISTDHFVRYVIRMLQISFSTNNRMVSSAVNDKFDEW